MQKHHGLGPSPDYLLYDSEETTPFEVGEVKCPFSKEEMTMLLVRTHHFLSMPNDKQSKPTLKRSHDYYYQVQGPMATCKVKWADFIVYTRKDTFRERIYFDHEL